MHHRTATAEHQGVTGSGGSRIGYVTALAWAFTVFNSARVICYLPTMWTIHGKEDSTQHSLWTWMVWVGANATMAAWLHEQNGRRMNRATAVGIGNALMCLATVALIVWYRL